MAKQIQLFYPNVSRAAKEAVQKVLYSRFIGQGPKVDEFEELWYQKISKPNKAIAVGSGTDALHLAYILAGIKEGDEVIAPIFTCTATNIPLLYQKAKIVFADVKKNNLNIDPVDVKHKINKWTKAIVCVDYGGLPADLDELKNIANYFGIPLIEDAAQAHGAMYKGQMVGSIADFTCFSFQAIKIITTGDGGMLTIKDHELEQKAKRIRWFGIDREAKLQDRWQNDITELGYKYQMTDIAASMGIEGLKLLRKTWMYHSLLFSVYEEELKGIPGITFIGDDKDHTSACWLATVLVRDREKLKAKLAKHGIESNQVHYRNDIYSIFGGRVNDCPNMDILESQYLVLPMHFGLNVEDITNICKIIRRGW